MFLHSSSCHFHFFYQGATHHHLQLITAASLGRCCASEYRNWVMSTTLNNKWGHSVSLLRCGFIIFVQTDLLINATPFTTLHNTRIKWAMSHDIHDGGLHSCCIHTCIRVHLLHTFVFLFFIKPAPAQPQSNYGNSLIAWCCPLSVCEEKMQKSKMVHAVLTLAHVNATKRNR